MEGRALGVGIAIGIGFRSRHFRYRYRYRPRGLRRFAPLCGAGQSHAFQAWSITHEKSGCSEAPVRAATVRERAVTDGPHIMVNGPSTRLLTRAALSVPAPWATASCSYIIPAKQHRRCSWIPHDPPAGGPPGAHSKTPRDRAASQRGHRPRARAHRPTPSHALRAKSQRTRVATIVAMEFAAS